MQSTKDTRGCYKSLRKTTVAWQMRFGWPVAPAAPSEISSPSLNYESWMSVNSNRRHEK